MEVRGACAAATRLLLPWGGDDAVYVGLIVEGPGAVLRDFTVSGPRVGASRRPA